MKNIMSVDVEEYFHAANLRPATPPCTWRALPSRVEVGTKRALEVFASAGVTGTFFILGWVARRCPGLVKEIAACGHELASHGYAHRLAYQQSPRQFARDVEFSKKLLEDLSGQEVSGYRAPNFSIKQENDWAYDTLIEAGYKYDSSIYPVWHPRYANTRKPTKPYALQRANGSLLIFPLATACYKLLNIQLRIPVAGGAYWRLFPRSLISYALMRIAAEKAPFVCYFHPWELDPLQPRFESLSLPTKIRHYGGLRLFEEKLRFFLGRFRFSSFREVIAESYAIEQDADD